MKIEKRDSGSYRVRKTYKGKMYNMTFDHKPSQKEITEKFTELITQKEKEDVRHMTFRSAAEKYVDMKRNVLSPNTVREYSRNCNRLSEWFVNMNIYQIDQIAINKQINELSSKLSPKTVRNYHGFISSILGTFRPDLNICTTLPQKRKNEPYIPSDDDVKRIIDYVKGTVYYVPIVLACYGMRRSEICAITSEDVDGDILHINKAIAFDEDNNRIIKPYPKTTESTRDIIIPQDIADLIIEKGYAFNSHPQKISQRLYEIEDKLGIQRFGVHKLRHYFASVLSKKGVPDADIMALGGWSTDNVMKTVYRHSMIDKETERKRDAMKNIGNSIF